MLLRNGVPDEPTKHQIIPDTWPESAGRIDAVPHFSRLSGAGRPNSLFFAGDLGQRIFQQPFSWKALGIDVRGRSSMLRINYRTSHQIRTQADRLLGPEVSDVDGNKEERKGTISTFNGPPPETTAGEDKVSREIEAFVRGNPAPGLQMRADVAALRPLGVFDRQSRYNKKAEDA